MSTCRVSCELVHILVHGNCSQCQPSRNSRESSLLSLSFPSFLFRLFFSFLFLFSFRSHKHQYRAEKFIIGCTLFKLACISLGFSLVSYLFISGLYFNAYHNYFCAQGRTAKVLDVTITLGFTNAPPHCAGT
jgi:hypothetical protein